MPNFSNQSYSDNSNLRDNSALLLNLFLLLTPIVAPLQTRSPVIILTLIAIISLITSIKNWQSNVYQFITELKSQSFLIAILIYGFVVSYYFSGDTAAAIKTGLMVLGVFMLWLYLKTQINKPLELNIHFLILGILFGAIITFLMLRFESLRLLIHDPTFGASIMNRPSLILTFFTLILIKFILLEHQSLNKHTKLLTALTVLFSIFTILYSQSETAKLILVAGLLLFLIAHISFLNLSKIILISSIVILLLLINLAPFWPIALFDYIANNSPFSFIPQNVWNGTIGARAEIWSASAELIQANPIFGSGFDSLRYSEGLNVAQLFIDDPKQVHPHSLFLQIWLDIGMIGSVVFSAFLIYQFIIKKQNNTNLIFLILIITASGISHGMWQAWWLALIAIIHLIIAQAFNHKKI